MALPEEHVCYIMNPHINEYEQEHWHEKKEIKITFQDDPLIHLYDHRQTYKRKVTLTVAEYLQLLFHWKSVTLHEFSSSKGKRVDISSDVHLWLPSRGYHINITNEKVQRPTIGEYLPFEKYRKLIKKQTFVILPEEYYQLFIISLPLLFNKISSKSYDIGVFHDTIHLEELFRMRCYVHDRDVHINLEQYLNSLPPGFQHALEYRTEKK